VNDKQRIEDALYLEIKQNYFYYKDFKFQYYLILKFYGCVFLI